MGLARRARRLAPAPPSPQGERAFSAEEEERLQPALGLDTRQLSLVLDTVTFVLQQAAYHLAKPALLSQHLLRLGLSEEMVATPPLPWICLSPSPSPRSRCSCRPGLARARRWLKNFARKHSTQSRLSPSSPSPSPLLHLPSLPSAQLEEVNWRLSLQMAQSSQAKMKQPSAVFELAVKEGEVGVDTGLICLCCLEDHSRVQFAQNTMVARWSHVPYSPPPPPPPLSP